MPVLERSDLLEELDGLLDAARGGRGAAVFVAGEAGVGKTTLVQSFLAGLDRSTRSLVGACDPLSTPRPLSPLLDVALDPRSGLSSLVDAQANPYEMFDAVLEMLRRTDHPTVLVMEDVHWADQATLDLVRYLGRRAGGTRALVICTYRDDEVGGDHPLRPVLGDLAPSREWVRRLHLKPLSVDAVAQLAKDHDADPVRVHELTGGNPFYVTELLAAGGALPATVADAVMARVERLDGDARRIVEVTSIAPRSLEVAYARELAGVDLAAAERAVHAGVLVGRGERLGFRHELARAAVEASMLPARCIELHHRMIELLEAAPRRDLARLAHHAHRTGEATTVHRYAPAAAEEAQARGAHRQAAEFYAAAIDHTGGVSPDELAELRLRLSWELYILNRPEEAAATVRAAVEHFRHRGDRVALARALSAQARVDWNLDPDLARATVEEAISLLESEPPGQPLAYAYYLAGHMNMLARRYEPAVAFAQRCLEVSRAHGLGREHELGTLALGTAELVVGDPDLGIDLLEGIVERATDDKEYRNRLVALGMLGSGGGEVRRYARAEHWLQDSIQLAGRFDEDYTAEYSTAWLARIAFERGNWDHAATLAAEVDVDGARITRLTAGGTLGRVRVRRGDPGAEELLSELAGLAADQELQHRWPITAGLAELAWLRNDAALGREIVEADYRRALATDSAWAKGELGFWMYQCGGISSPPAGAAEPFALHMSERWSEAAAAWQQIGCPYEKALALAAGGDERSLRTALHLLQRLGARPAADRIRAEMRALGIEDVPPRPRASTRSAPAMLTGRQLEVLELLRQGLTNAEIGEQLYISTKTAGHHVSAILRKLGARSRTEAAARAAVMGIDRQHP